MENNLENKTKKYITSLLTSTPLVVTLSQLSKDYLNTIGEPIPYQRLGYNSLEHFLRSIQDTVKVRGSGGTAEIIPIVSQKSAHVHELVANQKITKPRRRPYASQRRRTTNYAPPPAPRQYPKPALARKIFYPQATASSSSTQSQSFDYRNNNASAVPLISPQMPVSVPNKTTRIETVAETKIQVDKKLDDRLKLESKQHTEDKVESSTGSESKTTNVRNLLKKITPDKNKFCADQLESSVPYNVRSNLRSLINQCPKGIWCAEVPEKYRKMFKQELNYHELGFRSLIDLCVCLSSIFHYVRPSTEDFKLYDRSKPLPDCAETEFTFASYNIGGNKSSEPEQGALPNIEWSDINMFLPEGIFKPGQEIPRTFIPVEMADYELDIDVVVGEIYDLSKFWIYLQHSLLDALMDNIQEFYKDKALDYQIPEHLLKEGLYCVQIIFGEYHRALIVDVMPELEDSIRVIFIDYGTMTKVPKKGVCFLHEDFAHLPAQAIRCRLANILPLEEGIPWSREASKAFRKMVSNRDMSIKISHINWEDQFLEVYLADVTEEDNIYYINDRLVEEGFAQYPSKDRKETFVDPIYTSIVKYIHLFPTFLELEHGLAPSTAEMGILNDCEVPINFCYPQYFYIDYTFEEEIIKAAEDFHEKNCMKGKQRAPVRCYDLDQFKSQVPDMSIFGDLEGEITAFLNKPAEQTPTGSSDEDFVDADEEEFHARLDMMTEKFKYLSTKEEETVSVLKEDLLMTEDIMKDINSFCNFGDQSFERSIESQSDDIQSRCESEEDYRLRTIEETRESTDSLSSLAYCEESTDVPVEDSPYDQIMFSNHPLSKLTFDNLSSTEGSSSNSPRSEQSPAAKNGDYDLKQHNVWLKPINFSFLSTNEASLDRVLYNDKTFAPDLDDRVSYKSCEDTQKIHNANSSNSTSSGSRNKEITAKANKPVSTNPFLEHDSATTDTDLPPGLKLNPNNPFLSFLSNKAERESSSSSGSSQGSSTSTSYDSPIVQLRTMHSWSNFDDMSPETISQLGRTLSNNSSGDSSCANNYSMATQTVEVPPPPQTGPNPYYAHQQAGPYNYPNWSMGFANPYYNVHRFPNYQGYSSYDPAYGGMHQFRQHVGPPGFPPPPGFAPLRPNVIMPPCPPTFPRGTTYYPRLEGPKPQPYYAGGVPPQQGAALQYNRTTSVSVSVVKDQKDFYDVYNERLRLQSDSDTQ